MIDFDLNDYEVEDAEVLELGKVDRVKLILSKALEGRERDKDNIRSSLNWHMGKVRSLEMELAEIQEEINELESAFNGR